MPKISIGTKLPKKKKKRKGKRRYGNITQKQFMNAIDAKVRKVKKKLLRWTKQASKRIADRLKNA